MSKISFLNSNQTAPSASLLAVSRPAVPTEQKQSTSEQRIADPSSTLPKGNRYPIPSFFEYRAKPKEYDAL